MAKEKSSSSGCLVVGLILLVLGLLLLVPGALWLYKSEQRSVEVAARTEARHVEALRATDRAMRGSDGGVVVLDRDRLATITLPKPGEEITRERFLAFMIAPDATELTTEAFRRVAGEATVSWSLLTDNISERNGVLRGSFSLPWQIREGTGSTSSTLNIVAEFTEDSRGALLELRRGDWVEVTGDLRFSNGNPVLKNASLAGKAE